MTKHGAGAEMAKARPEKRPIPLFFQGKKLFTFLRTSPSPPCVTFLLIHILVFPLAQLPFKW
jgi:hypothetical protein